MAVGYSSAVVTMGHLALKRTIRHTEANDLVSRNVAALVDTPEGQQGRPSRSLILPHRITLVIDWSDIGHYHPRVPSRQWEPRSRWTLGQGDQRDANY
jgi:hypothetical protein